MVGSAVGNYFVEVVGCNSAVGNCFVLVAAADCLVVALILADASL